MYLRNWYIRQYLHAINSSFTVNDKDAPTHLARRAYAFRIHPLIIDSYYSCLWRLSTTKKNTTCNLLINDWGYVGNEMFIVIPKLHVDVIHYITWHEELRAVLWIGGYKITNFDGYFKYGLPVCICIYYDVRIYFYNKWTSENVHNVSVYVKGTMLETKYRYELRQDLKWYPVILNNGCVTSINSVCVYPGDRTIGIRVYPDWYHKLIQQHPHQPTFSGS